MSRFGRCPVKAARRSCRTRTTLWRSEYSATGRPGSARCPRSVSMYASVVSAAKSRNASSRLVASSRA